MNNNVIVRKFDELGANFPVGVRGPQGELRKSFELKELSGNVEREFAKFRKANPEGSEIVEVSKLLSLLFINIGGDPFSPSADRIKTNPDLNPTLEEGKDLFVIGQLDVADLYYAYCYARIQEMGADYNLPFMCNRCNLTDLLTVDLNSMDVLCLDDARHTIINIDLQIGFQSPSGRTIKKVTITPMKWELLADKQLLECGGEDILIKLFFIEKCTVYEDVIDKKKTKLNLTRLQVNSLKKIDREIIASKISLLNLGPSLQVEGTCPRCHMPFMSGVDWKYDNFFAISSL